jgi:hypothetical protein
MIALIALSIVVVSHSSFVTASSPAKPVGLSVVADRTDGLTGTDKK